MLIFPLNESDQMWRTTNKVEGNRRENQTEDERGRVNLRTLRDKEGKGDKNKKCADTQPGNSDEANKNSEGA